jgi:hypothetical protein
MYLELPTVGWTDCLARYQPAAELSRLYRPSRPLASRGYPASSIAVQGPLLADCRRRPLALVPTRRTTGIATKPVPVAISNTRSFGGGTATRTRRSASRACISPTLQVPRHLLRFLM